MRLREKPVRRALALLVASVGLISAAGAQVQGTEHAAASGAAVPSSIPTPSLPSAASSTEPSASAVLQAAPPEPAAAPPVVVPPTPSAPPAPSTAPSASAALPSSGPSAAPAPSASAGNAEAAKAEAKIHDTVVFVLGHGHGAKSAEDRAGAASEALTRAVETPGTEDVKVVVQGDASVVFAGALPVVELYAEDVEGTGFSTLDTYVAATAAHVHQAIVAEKKRSAIASTVFSFSLLVFLGLVAFYVIRKLGEFFDRVRQWTIDNPDRITGIRVQSQEVIGATTLRGGVMVTLIVGRFVAQIGVFYVWLVFALSLFQSTRPYTEKLTGFVVTPLSDLAGRLAATLPLAVMAAVSGVAVYVLLRFVQLFFEGVARRQTVLPWLSADLAAPTSVLVRAGVIVGTLVLIAPLVTGDTNGPLARAGSVALLVLGLSSTPLLASMLVGTTVIYGRRLRLGEHAEVGGRAGKVIALGLVDVRLRDRDGTEIRVPHLLSLFHPTRILGIRPSIVIDIATAGSALARDARAVIIEAAREFGDAPSVELVGIDADSAHYRVAVSAPADKTASDVRLALIDALAEAGISLGRGGRHRESP